jgi:hypothetical protein
MILGMKHINKKECSSLYHTHLQYIFWITCYSKIHLSMQHSQDKRLPVTTTWLVLRLQMNSLQLGGKLHIYWISSCGQLTRRGTTAWVLGELLTTTHRKNVSCYKTQTGASDLDWSSGSGSVWWHVESNCEHSNELLGSIKCREFFYKMRTSQEGIYPMEWVSKYTIWYKIHSKTILRFVLKYFGQSRPSSKYTNLHTQENTKTFNFQS